MSARPLASVLISTYNRGHFIEECIQSILAQTIPPHEIIVIDDGSTDDTAQRLKQYVPSVTYLHKENSGKPSSLNIALPLVTGEYVWFFDDDDVAYPDALESHLALLEENSSLGFSYSPHRCGTSGPDGRIIAGTIVEIGDFLGRDLLHNLLNYCCITLNGVLSRRTCFERIGGFREELIRAQDYEMLIRLARHFPSARTSSPTYILRSHPGPRGSATTIHAEAYRNDVWRKFDGMIGQIIRRDLQLFEYSSAASTQGMATIHQREALLRRAFVMATKNMPLEFFQDLHDLLYDRRLTGDRMTREEKQIVLSHCDHATFMHLVRTSPRFIQQLAQLRGSSPLARDLLRLLSKSLYWAFHRSVRNRDFRGAISRLTSSSRLYFASYLPNRLQAARKNLPSDYCT